MEVIGERKLYDEIIVEAELEIPCSDCTAKLRLPIHAGETATDTPVVLRRD
jgi:hypothetical protein